jgi:hypothetical protein
MALNDGDKAIVEQECWKVAKEAIQQHESNCPVKRILEVKKAYVIGLLFGVLISSGIGSGTVVTIILHFAGKL